ncbi:MAG: DUF3857 and transglutaminase domain-containing protein [Pseudomonadota bacterium]
MKCALAVAAALGGALAPACGAADTGTDPSLVIEQFVQHFQVNLDGSYTLTVDIAKTIAQPAALNLHALSYISYNRELDEVAAIEAYTQKPDGRRVPVLEGMIKDQQEASSIDAPMFQDTRMKVVVFPDVQVGDTLVNHYVLKRHRALFPGHFEDLSSSQFFANRRYQLIYDMPAEMPLYADAAGFRALAVDSAPGRRRYAWQYESGENARIEADSVSYLDYGKRLAVSTFPDYAAFARAYAQGARAAATPDASVQALALALTQGVRGPRAQALALANWVRQNIRYLAVYVGAGAVVPHPAATVLKNRYGDCKDQASLLEALLAAVGIDSSAVLVNSGNAYRLPRVPTLGVFNHVLSYVPRLALYLDTTASAVAPGYLPASELDKPVLLVTSGELARTPASQREKSSTVALFQLALDGSGSFHIARRAEGAGAEGYRQALRASTPSARAQFAQRVLLAMEKKGRGVLLPGALDDDGDSFALRVAGSSENLASLPGPSGLASNVSFWGGLGEWVAAMTQEPQRRQDFVCPAIDTEEETAFLLARGVRILALPRPLAVGDAGLAYRAAYTRQGNAIVVKRSLRFAPQGMVCTPADFQRLAPLLEGMQRDLQSQIVIGTGTAVKLRQKPSKSAHS